jgi:hypothetical protein
VPRKCNICSHEKLKEINQALIDGQSLRNIAKQYQVSYSAVNRHKKEHLPAALVKAQEAQAVTQADSLLDQVEALRAKAVNLLEQAENAGDLKTALQGIGQARACLELLAKVRGELQQEGQVNITFNAEWIELRSIILQTLEPYPEARERLAEALEGVEG